MLEYICRFFNKNKIKLNKLSKIVDMDNTIILSDRNYNFKIKENNDYIGLGDVKNTVLTPNDIDNLNKKCLKLYNGSDFMILGTRHPHILTAITKHIIRYALESETNPRTYKHFINGIVDMFIVLNTPNNGRLILVNTSIKGHEFKYKCKGYTDYEYFEHANTSTELNIDLERSYIRIEFSNRYDLSAQVLEETFTEQVIYNSTIYSKLSEVDAKFILIGAYESDAIDAYSISKEEAKHLVLTNTCPFGLIYTEFTAHDGTLYTVILDTRSIELKEAINELLVPVLTRVGSPNNVMLELSWNKIGVYKNARRLHFGLISTNGKDNLTID